MDRASRFYRERCGFNSCRGRKLLKNNEKFFDIVGIDNKIMASFEIVV